MGDAEDKEIDTPPVPIPTYLWEELRRSKTKGFYPWTHVFKPPFDEDVWLRENGTVGFKKGSGKKRSVLALGFLTRISLGDGWERCSRCESREKGGGARFLFEDSSKPESEPSLLMQRSRSASSSSVRCGCQYFQSTDPLPERRSLVGTPPLSRTPTMGDHEYEPINPIEPPPPAILAPEEVEEVVKERPPTPTVFERRYIKIPNEDAIIIPLHGDSDEEINPDRYQDKSLVQEVQEVKQVQFNEPEEFIAPTITISQPDSPEPLPLERTARGMRTRLKSQAGEFRDKLRKISLPDHKIKMPNRPKINFPDRPQFLKEKPKFLTERPKFLSERPKFLSERPKFLSEKPKFLKERPKFNIDRSKFKIPEGLFERHTKKGPKQKRPNPSSLRRPLRDTVTVTSSDSSRKFFETLKFRSYPRFLSKKKREQEMKVGSLDTESSPSTPPSRRKPEWVEPFTDVKFVDEEPKMEQEEDYEESTAHFRDAYVRGALLLGTDDAMKAKIDSDIESDKEQQSSGSESMRRRAGVLEEIDSDEFFLRQKGLSREDMDVSRYLSKEIRDAFRSPKNALAHMDSTDYDDEGPIEEPKPPERKKSIKSVQSERIDYNTFPSRPNRRKQSEPDFGSKEDFQVRKPPRKYRSKSDSRQRSTPSLARSRSQGMEREETPSAPKRRSKSSKSLSSRHSMGENVEDVHIEIDARDRSPVVPFRKSRSRGTSLADEDRTSRGADSADLPHDFHEVNATLVRAPTEDSFGYAIVHKEPKKVVPPRPPPPSRHKRQLHQLQSQFHNIKNHGVNFFFTYPRRAIKSLHRPVRPVRNYSTLGPSRPPRRTRVFREPVYVDDVEEIEVQEKHEELKALQSGSVERIQGRPLPAPPRPPRKSKDDEFLTSEQTETFKYDFEDIEKTKVSEMMNTSQQTSFEVAEVSVSIQTDPLPEDYVVDDEVSRTYRQSIEREFIRNQEESREDTPPPLPERSLPSLLRNLPTFPVSFPDKLHLTELEVDKLNVNELQASKLQVSDMETMSLQVKELNSQGGNLVVNGIELPPDFFKNLAAQFPVRESPQAVPQLRRVLTPPPPIIVQHVPTTNEVAQPQPSQASTTDQLPKPKTTKSRGRKSPTRVIDDSEDELASVLPEKVKIEKEKLKPTEPSRTEPSAFDLVKQLLAIWIRNVYQGTGSLIEGINSMFPEGEKRRDAQIAAVILVVIISALILIGFGYDNSVHHHHWDYLPPR